MPRKHNRSRSRLKATCISSCYINVTALLHAHAEPAPLCSHASTSCLPSQPLSNHSIQPEAQPPRRLLLSTNAAANKELGTTTQPRAAAAQLLQQLTSRHTQQQQPARGKRPGSACADTAQHMHPCLWQCCWQHPCNTGACASQLQRSTHLKPKAEVGKPRCSPAHHNSVLGMAPGWAQRGRQYILE